MVGKIEESYEDVAFVHLLRRTSPVVLRKRAKDWPGCSLVTETFGALASLRTTFRLHPHCNKSIWEANCLKLEATLQEWHAWTFAKAPVAEDNPFAAFPRERFWAYADYKHMAEMLAQEGLPAGTAAAAGLVRWAQFGLGDKNESDSTFWLGTEGAHTPLHQDTYGVNLVAQLHGRKTWTLFPPEDGANLYPTRIPYEESSVFSEADLCARPDVQAFPAVTRCRPVTAVLETGDVLFVPKHWWHFVYSDTVSLSINVWVDVPGDAADRAAEALVRLVMTCTAELLAEERGPGWLNPTETVSSPHEALRFVNFAMEALPPPPPPPTTTTATAASIAATEPPLPPLLPPLLPPGQSKGPFGVVGTVSIGAFADATTQAPASRAEGSDAVPTAASAVASSQTGE
ncbi:unnamed protein product [Phaeothamnion confervicola]